MIEIGKAYGGSCLCGAVRYEIVGPSLYEMHCCCRDCQKATGTGHTTIVGLHRSQLRVEGTPSTYTNAGESGGEVTRHFCGHCGGRIYTSGTLPGEVIMIQAGSLDDPNRVTPTEVIYHCDAVRWDDFSPALPLHHKYAAFSDIAVRAMNGDFEGPSIEAFRKTLD